MSLVNDMLRDLNKRAPVSNRAARVHSAINSSIENKRPKVRVGLLVVGIVAAGLLASYLYFDSMGMQTVQVPLAEVPVPSVQAIASQEAVQQEPVAPSVAPPSSPVIADPAAAIADSAAVNADPAAAIADPASSAAADMPAVELLAEIRELATQPDGFTLLVELSEATTFDVLDRSDHGITVHVGGVDKYDRSAAQIPGMSLLLVGDGLEIGFRLDEPTDFLVREDTETAGFDLLITATRRPPEDLSASAPAAPVIPEVAPPAIEPEIAVAGEPAVEPEAAPAPQTPPPSPTAASGDGNGAVRVAREQGLEVRDRNNSQSALMLVQGGRMAEALQQLRIFVEENPAAHQSRETLAKLLLAQQAFPEAATVIDQGLEQVPNYAPFKKIKARLFMQSNEPVRALELLRNVPPPVTADIEYHELLATLYQQGNYHQQAVSSYQQLLRTDRTQGRWWTGLGISLEAQDQDANALASYQAALQSPNLDASLRRFVQGRISNLGSPQ